VLLVLHDHLFERFNLVAQKDEVLVPGLARQNVSDTLVLLKELGKGGWGLGGLGGR